MTFEKTDTLRPRLKVLNQEQMWSIHAAALEILKNTGFQMKHSEAREMLSSIKGAALLEGVRGQKGVDQAKLMEIIQRLSQLLTDLPDIAEMDLNPLMAFEDKVFAVDARIAL